MYQRRVSLLCFSIALWAFSGSLLAQQQNDDIAPGMISGTSTFASPYADGLWGEYFPRVSVQHRTEGAGYDYSFTDFRGWVPLYESYDAQSLTYFDGAFLLSNDRNVGMNAVVGQRFYFEELDRTFGGFVGYDNRDTGSQTVGQVVTGFESLGLIDFRVNGYFPTDTSPVSTGGGTGGFSDPVYVGNVIQLTQLNQFEVAMKGFDAEVGGALPKIGDYVRAYLGLYNFQGEDSPQAWGWKTRFESHITDRVRLYLTVTDDQVFDTNVVFGAAFFFPGSSARRVPRYDSYVNKMDEPLVRNEAVVVNTISESSIANATNPVTMADQQVIHVDPNAAAAGDGTVENPYNTLAAAQAGSAANDIIFVHPRSDGTTTNLTHALSLKENQRLLGSTTQHQFTATQGTFDLPGYEAGNRPMLASGGGDVVTLADNNEVSGFRFNNPSSEAIFGSGINGFNINNNSFAHSGTNSQTSLLVLNATGTGVIRDNTFSNTTTFVGNSIRANLTGTANLTIDGNRITRVVSTGGADAIFVDSPGSSDVTLNITDNYVSNFVTSSGHGIDLFLSGNVNANISGNEIYQGVAAGVTDYGVYVRYGRGTVTIDDNRIGSIATASLVDSGIRVSAFSTTTANTYITNNTISDFLTATAFGSGIEFESTAQPSTNNVVMTGNSVSHSLAAGFTNGYSVVSAGDTNLNFQNNTTSGTFGDYAADFVSNDDTFNMRMRNNTLSDDVRVRDGTFSHEFNFEVFGGQTIPGLVLPADVAAQNTISGTVFVENSGLGVQRAAPNSLPIPE